MDDKEMSAMQGLLNGVPLEPKLQWKMVARVNAMRQILIEFIAAEKANTGEESIDIEELKKQIGDRIDELEERCLEKINDKRKEGIKERAKEARYRSFT